jgi:large subunit ribosomal protein L24
LALQTTLLGVAIALILALVAALVGPMLVDWGTYRALFEREASHLVGVDVRVAGPIEARLLPSPRLVLQDIEIGGGAEKVRAHSLGIEFALGPLMRGEWHASEMHLDGPQVNLGVDASGHVKAPDLTVAFNPDALSIDRLSIENGKLTLTDAANGASVTLDRFWFNGEARSLLGPFRGEGAVTIGGDLYPYRVSAGRYGDDATVKLHLNVDPVNHPMSIESDGTLTLAAGAPSFDGTVSIARPVGVAKRGGVEVTQPWHVSGKVKATAKSALMDNFEFQYGSEDQALKLTGVADFQFGKRPSLSAVLSGRQVDFDRALVQTDGNRPPPAAALRQLVAFASGAVSPTFPMKVGVGIDQLTLGGSSVQNFRGDISSAGGGWNLDRFEFRAPGFTQVKLSGKLAMDGDHVSFTGPAEVDAGDPKVLAAWLEGRGDVTQGDLRPLSLRGEVTLGSDKMAVERLKAEFERKTVAGRLAYSFAEGNKPAKLDADLNAPDLDIDAALDFGKALLAGSTIARPHDMTIAAEIGRATVGGFTARNASARVKVDGDGLQIDKLSVADLGGAAFSASGSIVTGPSTPQGNVRVDLDAPDPAPVIALLSRFAPQTAQTLGQAALAMAPAKLHGAFTIEGASGNTQGKLSVDGSLGKVRVALNGQGKVDPVALTAGNIQLAGKFDADDGRGLVAMLGLNRVAAPSAGPGTLTINATGPASGDLKIDTRLLAGGIEASAVGTARLFADKPSAEVHANILRADVAPLRGAGGARTPLPLTYAGRITLAGRELTFSDINATLAGNALRGKLAVTLEQPRRVQGEIEAANANGAGLLASAIGLPASQPTPDGRWTWSNEPFAGGFLGAATGQVALKARRAELLPGVTAREVRTTLRLGKDDVSFDDITGNVAGGQLTGQVSFHAADAGLQAHAKFSLTNTNAASLLGSGARPPIAGSFSLSGEVNGTGLSPVALIGSLQGSGTVTLTDAQLAGLDPRAFDAVTRAVDQGLPVDAARLGEVVRKGLDSGQFAVKQINAPLALSAGQVQLASTKASGQGADMSLSGNLDLTDGSVDARLILSGSSEAAGARPDIYMSLRGPFTSPARAFDLSALTGWLTLRAVENQSKKLQAIERERAAKSETPPQTPALPQASPVPLFPPVSPPPQPPASELAPVLPAPVDIGRLPMPGALARPEASVGR